MKRYFLNKHDEFCSTKAQVLATMKQDGIIEKEVFEAKIAKNTGFFFCKHHQEVGEVGQGCGKECAFYIPRNGKNGRCKESGQLYENTGIKIKFKLK